MKLNYSNKIINFKKKRGNKGGIGNSDDIVLEITSATYFLPCTIGKTCNIYVLPITLWVKFLNLLILKK